MCGIVTWICASTAWKCCTLSSVSRITMATCSMPASPSFLLLVVNACKSLQHNVHIDIRPYECSKGTLCICPIAHSEFFPILCSHTNACAAYVCALHSISTVPLTALLHRCKVKAKVMLLYHYSFLCGFLKVYVDLFLLTTLIEKQNHLTVYKWL
jgi:hypothetical protein